MENAKSKIINEIAQDIDMGYDCYYNPQTDEIISIPDLDQALDEEVIYEAFGEQIKEVTDNSDKYIKFKPLWSRDSFKIMERFADQMEDQEFQAKLYNALNRRKPFRNFKNIVDSSDYRQTWFDFKIKALEEFVAEELKHRKPGEY
ncbi:MAG TPA: UPF0158 family protein [Flavobacteriaceae bacterium]|nr:UPF0158 family protein [Flavobacteriaceae bacterium]